MKRLIIEALKDKHTNNVSLTYFVEKVLVPLMMKYGICGQDNNRKEIRKDIAWISIIREFSNYKAKNSLEALGLIAFEYNGIDSLGNNKKLGLTEKEFKSILKILLYNFRKNGAVTIPFARVKENIKKAFVAGRNINFVEEPQNRRKYVESWKPASNGGNRRSKLVLKYLPNINSLGFLSVCLQRLTELKVLKYEDRSYCIDLDNVRICKGDKIYICDKCKTVQRENFRNICNDPSCTGILSDFNKPSNGNVYYDLYTSLAIGDLIIQEHTAQLAPEKAYEYQNMFKDKLINVLSCSTTFEMGVDLGSLETVYMRNMPPTPANYVQRAGRAGRSSNAAAYSLTFCPNNSHDRTYYKNPINMIKGEIAPPVLDLYNEKIVLRHIYASAFSFFWKEYRHLYSSKVGEFFGKNIPNIFKEYCESKPKNLFAYLQQIVPKKLHQRLGIDSFAWINFLFTSNKDNPGKLDIACGRYNEDLSSLYEGVKKADDIKKTNKFDTDEWRNADNMVKSLLGSINRMKNNDDIITFLTSNNLLPKYSFPVDTVELYESFVAGQNRGLRLSRDLFTAIAEYAPEGEIIADGKIFKSRYIKLLKGFTLPKYLYKKCNSCGSLQVALFPDVNDDLHSCKTCDNIILDETNEFIIPQYGFIMDNAEPIDAGTEKPDRTYKSEISYIGDDSKIQFTTFELNSKKVEIGGSFNDSLVVINETGFYYCEDCGYSKLDKVSYDRGEPYVYENHDNSRGYNCPKQKLSRIALGHKFETDVAIMKFKDITITDFAQALSILYSILEGLSHYLNIERREISGCLKQYYNEERSENEYAFVVFDNTPGGAGYVKKLANSSIEELNKIMLKSFEIVAGCNCGGLTCDTSCYDCLRNYYNQKFHDIIRRDYGINFFEELLGINKTI